MTELEYMVRKYAFVNDCDVDKATMKVFSNIVNEAIMKRSTTGLFDKLFKEAETTARG